MTLADIQNYIMAIDTIAAEREQSLIVSPKLFLKIQQALIDNFKNGGKTYTLNELVPTSSEYGCSIHTLGYTLHIIVKEDGQ